MSRTDKAGLSPGVIAGTGTRVRSTLDPRERLIKRFFDLVAAVLLILLCLPLMAIVAIAIWLDSPGPIIFRQERVGEAGRRFRMYKFRSMIDAPDGHEAQQSRPDERGQWVGKQVDDPRVTRIGRLLRRTSLDELPQLLNVIRGEMSLVGPRPELPWIVEQLYEPWQLERLTVPQGMTGWWQVQGRSVRPMYLKTGDDLYYIQHYTFWLDLYILLRTVGAVIRGRGAY